MNGEWQVPRFVAGHLEGTADLGRPGNVVLSGHLESLTSGNVFADLGKLAPGDRIALLTDTDEFQYRVNEKRVVRRDDLSVVAPTPEETLTLITCTGTWQPLIRDYDQRLVVIASRMPKGNGLGPALYAPGELPLAPSKSGRMVRLWDLPRWTPGRPRARCAPYPRPIPGRNSAVRVRYSR